MRVISPRRIRNNRHQPRRLRNQQRPTFQELTPVLSIVTPRV
jgi:hypothetical protein